jgi:hypothetical protein
MKLSPVRAVVPVGACAVTLFGVSIYCATQDVRAATNPTSNKFACNTAAPCASVENRGSGVATKAIGQNNTGIEGTTFGKVPLLTTVNGYKLSFTSGVVGNDYSSPSVATNVNQGVAGFSRNSDGMYGVTGNTCNCGSTNDVDTFYPVGGVFGFDAGPLNGFTGPANVGVAGQSFSRVGGVFLARTGYGAVGRTFTGTGVLGVSRGAGGVALAARSLLGGPVFEAFNATAQVASIDSSGNLVLAGKIRTADAPEFTAKSVSGANVVTYGARQSMATVEDFGTAQMRTGYARVALNPAFAALIDRHTSYMVFVTPEGDNRGLYVANKTFSDFAVRESQSGRSSLGITYRIVARALGARDSRFETAVAPAPIAAPAFVTQASKSTHRLSRGDE